MKVHGLPLVKWSINDLDLFFVNIPIHATPELVMLDNIKSIILYLPPKGTEANTLFFC